MSRKKKNRPAAAVTIVHAMPKPELPIPALLLRIGLILAAAALVQQFLPHP